MKKILLILSLSFCFTSYSQNRKNGMENFKDFEGSTEYIGKSFYGEVGENPQISSSEKKVRTEFLESVCPELKIELEKKRKKIKALLIKSSEDDQLIARLTTDDYKSWSGVFVKKETQDQRSVHLTFTFQTNGFPNVERRQYYLIFEVKKFFGGEYQGRTIFEDITRKCEYIIN